MSKVYVTSDLHFGHFNMAKRRGFFSAEEHDIFIINNWNKLITKHDTIIILGDISLGNTKEYVKLNLLKGIKQVVLGNHDSCNIQKLLPYVKKVYGCKEYKHCLLTHIPVHPSQFDRYRLNIHGHLHDSEIDDDRYINVSLERTNFQPVCLSNIIKIENVE